MEATDVTVRSVRPDEYDAVGDLCVAAYDAIGLASEHYVPTLRDTAARSAQARTGASPTPRPCAEGAVASSRNSASPARAISP